MHLFQDRDVNSILAENKIGGNVGNSVFLSAVARVIMTQDSTIDFLSTLDPFYFDDEIKQMNENYDMFIIPLANAFRDNFMNELKALTLLVNKLKIPSVVIGIGLQNKFNGTGFEFDDCVKKFVNAVLKKSKCLGLRDENTAKYLEFLGYKRNEQFMVIGCPSMYYYGDKLPELKNEHQKPNRNSVVNITLKYAVGEKYHNYIQEQKNNFDKVFYSVQNIDEIRLQYSGLPLNNFKTKVQPFNQYYPRKITDEICKNVRAFAEFTSWRNYLSEEVDFSFGNRIHGNITSILSGVPCFIIACDSRVEGLAEYHKIPYVALRDLDTNKSILQYFAESDYDLMRQNHKENFNIYKSFLLKNGITTIFETSNADNCPFDIKMSELPKVDPIKSLSLLSCDEIIERIGEYDRAQEKVKKLRSKRIKKFERKYTALNKKYNKLLNFKKCFPVNIIYKFYILIKK